MNNLGTDKHDDITLKILDEINRESLITQRTLSSDLNIALGLVNTYIKRLAKKGHIKITKGPMNRVKYALTRKGFTHRVSLTYNFMQSSMTYFKKARLKIDIIYEQMIQAGVKSILIWGDGEIAELCYISLRGLPIKLIGVVDANNKENDFFGHHIYSFEDVTNLEYDAILIASFGKTEVQKIEDLEIDQKKIYSFK
jgi:predicted transcriptional regulator